MRKLICVALLLMLASLYAPPGLAQESEKPARSAENPAGSMERISDSVRGLAA